VSRSVIRPPELTPLPYSAVSLENTWSWIYANKSALFHAAWLCPRKDDSFESLLS